METIFSLCLALSHGVFGEKPGLAMQTLVLQLISHVVGDKLGLSPFNLVCVVYRPISTKTVNKTSHTHMSQPNHDTRRMRKSDTD